MLKLDNIKITIVTESFKRELLKSFIARSTLERKNSTLDSIRFTLKNREAQDRIYTSLKRLNYQKFYCTKAPDGNVFLCGKTDDLILPLKRDRRSREEGDKYNVGPYHVCISIGSFVKKVMDNIHVFPDYDPKAKNRHLHHYATGNARSGEIDNPLTARPNWCWASVGPSYRSALQDADWVDLFRVMYIFLVRLDYSSPLASNWVLDAMRHGERV